MLHAAASALRPTSPDGAGTAAPTHANRSLGGQLAIEAAAQGKRRTLTRKPFSLASGYGCGAPMQTAEEATL
jgi:nitric-oxide synthase